MCQATEGSTVMIEQGFSLGLENVRSSDEGIANKKKKEQKRNWAASTHEMTPTTIII